MKNFLLSTIAVFCLATPATALPVSNGQLRGFLDAYFNSATKSENTGKYFCGAENNYLFNQPIGHRLLGYRTDDNGGYRVRVQVETRTTSRTVVGNVYEISITQHREFCINGLYILPNEFATS